MTIKVVSVVGARPQFIKVAPLVRSFDQFELRSGLPVDHVIVHTGQHYDASMSDVFFDELRIPPATFNLGVGSGSHGSQTGQMLAKIEETLLSSRPDIVVAYGDTNSALAATLSAAKLHIPVADDETRLRKVLGALDAVAATTAELVFPLHPRTAKVVRARFPAWSPHPRLRVVPPLGYLDTLSLVGHARMLLTDSGGLQKEAFFLGCPCITLRDETEWVETVQGGGNILAGVEPDAIREAVSVWDARVPAGRA